MLHAVENQDSLDQLAGKGFNAMSIRIDNAEFLVTQDEVVTFESIPELNSSNKSSHSLGTISVDGQDTQVYGLSGELEFIEHIPDGRDTCVVLRKGNQMIGLICNEFKALELTMFNVQKLPECMSHNKSPIGALCVYQLKDGLPAIGKVLTADAISAYIRLY